MAKEQKKEMKVAAEKKIDFSAIRKLFNKVLTSNKGLILTENKWGAVQVREKARGLLFSARSDGNLIMTHPMFDAKKARVFSTSAGWEHFSEVPFGDVTEKMLVDRIKDKKSGKDYEAEIYKGREAESGIRRKSDAAKKAVEDVQADAKKAKASIKTDIKKAKEAKMAKVSKVAKKAILAVTEAKA